MAATKSNRSENKTQEFQETDGYCHVWTDGACPGNGKNGARAGLGVWWKKDHDLNVSSVLDESMKQTNNEAEIMAAVVALRLAKRKKMAKLMVHTDSKFLISCCTDWVNKWQKNDWKNNMGLEVANRKSLEEYLSLLGDIEIKFEYVQSHSGDEGNEAADALARGAVARALSGKPVTKTIGIPQRLAADASYSTLEHRAYAGLIFLAKIGGFGPVVATATFESEMTRVRGCLVADLENVTEGQVLIIKQTGRDVDFVTKFVNLTVQVGDVVADVKAFVLDDLSVPLVLGADWMDSIENFGIDYQTLLPGLVSNGRELEPVPVVPYSPGGKDTDFEPACRIVSVIDYDPYDEYGSDNEYDSDN